MSFIDLILRRRARAASAARCSQTYQPRAEVLEERQCLSVAAPTGLHLAAVAPTQVKVMWNDVANETSYAVFRWDGINSVLVGSVAKNVTSFTVGSLAPNQTYFFSVEARDLSTSARSVWASILTPADPITAPTNVRISNLGQTALTVQWRNATGATGYRVYNWDGTRATLVGTATPTTPALTINNLTPGVNYYFYVQAFNNTNSATSDWVSATTLSFGIAAPTNFRTQVLGASTIGLSWNDSATETGYRVFRWDGSTFTTPVVIATLTANTTGYQAIGLLPGNTYWFYVQAFNASNFANTPWVTATTVAALPLQPPTQLNIDITGPNSVALSWTEPARAVGYRVFLWSGNSWVQVMTVPAGTHKAPINGLGTNTTQWFFVQAFTDHFAEVSYSSAVFANL